MPQVSAIIPLYNKGPYIRRALDSVSAQTFDDFECVVVDDGSTDEGPEIVMGYDDPRIRLIRQENAGPGAARNRGIRESSAPYVGFLDADDEWLPEFLQESVRRLEKNPECALSVSGYFEGRDRSNQERFLREGGVITGPWLLPTGTDPRKMKFVFGPVFCSWAIVCRREVLDRLGGFYDRNHCTYGEDMYLWLRVVLNYSVYRDPGPLVWYHSENSELDKWQNIAPPLEPFFTDPQPLRRDCPLEHAAFLEDFLAWRALRVAHRALAFGDVAVARYLTEGFPLMRKWPREYRRLRMKLLAPETVRYLHRLRSLWRPSKYTILGGVSADGKTP